MGYSTFDSRIKSSLDIAKDENITIDIEDEGKYWSTSTVLISKQIRKTDVIYIEVIGISIGGGTIKLKGIM